MSVKLVVVDDHRLFREGLRALLTTQSDLSVVGEASEAQSAYSMVERMQPDVVVLDVSLPMASGFSIAREVLRRQPQQRILA
ncbi:MAG TPA: response regulator transcription factor, partial [Myxococcales bacterium]|nr:response regulator transcription factor [Myxococcales bacterium]